MNPFLSNCIMFGVLLFLNVAVIPQPSYGQSPEPALGLQFATDPAQPINIKSDNLSVDAKLGVAVFSGKPMVSQGRLTIVADHLNAEWAPGQAQSFTRLLAKGNVIITSANGRVATGQWATYLAKEETVTMGDQVKISQPTGPNGDDARTISATELTGRRLVVDMTSGQARLLGGSPDGTSNSRVRGVFTPGNGANN